MKEFSCPSEVRLMPATPDGCRELVLEVNGRILATTVVRPCDDDREQRFVISLGLAYLGGELLRKC